MKMRPRGLMGNRGKVSRSRIGITDITENVHVWTMLLCAIGTSGEPLTGTITTFAQSRSGKEEDFS